MKYPIIAAMVVQIILIALKLTDVIDWRWTLVMIPTYSIIAVCVLLAAIITFMKLK